MFHRPIWLGDRVELVEIGQLGAEKALAQVPATFFTILDSRTQLKVGQMDFRHGNNHELEQWCGHIGYEIYPKYRCQGYATDACLAMAQYALAQGFDALWITCNPDNTASNRVCQKIGARYINTVDVPKDYELYERGDRQKRRYYWRLGTSQMP